MGTTFWIYGLRLFLFRSLLPANNNDSFPQVFFCFPFFSSAFIAVLPNLWGGTIWQQSKKKKRRKNQQLFPWAQQEPKCLDSLNSHKTKNILCVFMETWTATRTEVTQRPLLSFYKKPLWDPFVCSTCKIGSGKRFFGKGRYGRA